MSYRDPAPFKQLLLIAEGIKHSVEALQKHPEGAKAFAAWVDDADFDGRYNVRYKDLPVDDEVPETMILVTDSFGIDDEGRLYCESKYTTFYWQDGRWVNPDDPGEEEEEQYQEWAEDDCDEDE